MPVSVRPIGLLGGSFDPVHLGHVAVAEAVLAARGLRAVLLVPAAVSPHKQGRTHAAAEDRLAMVEMAVAGRPGLAASGMEIVRGGPSYTVDTVEALLQAGEGPIEFIVGADSLPELPTWRRAFDLARLAQIVAVDRPGHAFEPPRGFRIVRVEVEPIACSSTDIRRRVAAGETIAGLVPMAVAEYIVRRGLYRGQEEEAG